MKTPEEIKKGLECCSYNGRCDDCPYNVTVEGAYGTEELGCDGDLNDDSLAYIQQLEEALDMAFEALRIVDKDASEREKQLEEQIPRWVSVDERMPGKYVGVIVRCNDGYIDLMLHNGASWQWNGKTDDNVTHWMPLPKPPEEVQP